MLLELQLLNIQGIPSEKFVLRIFNHAHINGLNIPSTQAPHYLYINSTEPTQRLYSLSSGASTGACTMPLH